MNTTKNGVANKVTIASLLVALGIIYGDIGTSPLYVFKAIIGTKDINEMLVYGGVSCVFWTLVFQTTIKYIWLTLRADNQGEGGIFSLYGISETLWQKISHPNNTWSDYFTRRWYYYATYFRFIGYRRIKYG